MGLCTLLIFSCMMACVPSQRGTGSNSLGSSGPAQFQIEMDDPCADKLRRLKAYDKSTIISNEFSNLSECIATNAVESFLNAVVNNNTNSSNIIGNCQKKLNIRKITQGFIATSSEEQKWLNQVNREVDRLQRCRDKMAKSILHEIKTSKNTQEQSVGIAKYKDFKKKIDADNVFLDNLLAKSGKRIQNNEKVAKDVGLVSSSSTANKLKVKSGYNIRRQPKKAKNIIGRTRSGNIEVKAVEGKWVRIAHESEPFAYVSKKAFPSLTPKAKAQIAHVNTRKELEKSKAKTYDYKKDMEDNLAMIDDAIERTEI